ncbi:hypothetical protein BL253_32205 [Pseudofrankia asymbiotica]|uniref:Uncharacterized protein n=1 Tax=Pseudofrankia asymbiotica TaxID=1834516 RepID=A0A1V2I274_9ACTN|nr:hypothetical protein BL253_32205 [Pseudofrankia asymbiotica]
MSGHAWLHQALHMVVLSARLVTRLDPVRAFEDGCVGRSVLARGSVGQAIPSREVGSGMA